MNVNAITNPPLLANCRDLARHIAARRSGLVVTRWEIDWRLSECSRALIARPVMPRTPRRGHMRREVAT